MPAEFPLPQFFSGGRSRGFGTVIGIRQYPQEGGLESADCGQDFFSKLGFAIFSKGKKAANLKDEVCAVAIAKTPHFILQDFT